jgi:hypothetical protein
MITERSLPVFTLGNDAGFCSNQSVTIQPSVVYPGSNFLWNTNATSPSITVSIPGNYWLKMFANNACTYSDSIQLSTTSPPLVNLGGDTTLCRGTVFNLSVNFSNASFAWNTGSSNNAINVSNDGTYWADVTQNGCTSRDSVVVSFTDVPVVTLGTDTGPALYCTLTIQVVCISGRTIPLTKTFW